VVLITEPADWFVPVASAAMGASTTIAMMARATVVR
jgi:hypothetical protein